MKYKKKKSLSDVRKASQLRKYFFKHSKKPPRNLSVESNRIDQIRLEISKLELELHTIREECPPIVKSLKSLVKELKRKGKLNKGFFV